MSPPPRPNALVAAALLFLCAAFAACGDIDLESAVREETLPLSTALTDGRSVEFIPHVADEPFGSWLGMNLPFAPAQALRFALEDRLRADGLLATSAALIGRDEAHITVITPPEFDGVLKSKMTIAEINEIASGHGPYAARRPIQQALLAVHSLGRAQIDIDGRPEQAYYVIVEAPDLLTVRQRVAELYRARGGEPSRFDPTLFYPHITIAFSARDLHLADGVYKGKNSRYIGLQLVK